MIWHCLFTVYQLQNEAPKPKKMVCKREVRKMVVIVINELTFFCSFNSVHLKTSPMCYSEVSLIRPHSGLTKSGFNSESILKLPFCRQLINFLKKLPYIHHYKCWLWSNLYKVWKKKQHMVGNLLWLTC